MDAIVDKATEDAHALETAGFDAVLVEATMDKPMGMVRGPLQLAAMSVICGAVHRAVHIPMGVSYLTPDCRDVFPSQRPAEPTSCGLLPLSILCTSRSVPSSPVRSKHGRCGVKAICRIFPFLRISKSNTQSWSIRRRRWSSQRTWHRLQGADAIVVTGNATGEETPMETIRRVAKVSKIPIVVGSGVAPSNVRTQMELARGFIVGTSVKQDGNLMAPIDLALASELARARDRG